MHHTAIVVVIGGLAQDAIKFSPFWLFLVMITDSNKGLAKKIGICLSLLFSDACLNVYQKLSDLLVEVKEYKRDL